MSVIPTKVLFDKFFEGKDPETVRKTRAQVDRPEVYAYEAKIGNRNVNPPRHICVEGGGVPLRHMRHV